MRKGSFYGQLSATGENTEDLKIRGKTTQCTWWWGAAYVFKSPHQKYIRLRTTATATVLIKSIQREQKEHNLGQFCPWIMQTGYVATLFYYKPI